MTDLDTILDMLKRAGLAPITNERTADGGTLVEFAGGDAVGYSGFLACLKFNAAGELVGAGGVE